MGNFIILFLCCLAFALVYASVRACHQSCNPYRYLHPYIKFQMDEMAEELSRQHYINERTQDAMMHYPCREADFEKRWANAYQRQREAVKEAVIWIMPRGSSWHTSQECAEKSSHGKNEAIPKRACSRCAGDIIPDNYGKPFGFDYGLGVSPIR